MVFESRMHYRSGGGGGSGKPQFVSANPFRGPSSIKRPTQVCYPNTLLTHPHLLLHTNSSPAHSSHQVYVVICWPAIPCLAFRSQNTCLLLVTLLGLVHMYASVPSLCGEAFCQAKCCTSKTGLVVGKCRFRLWVLPQLHWQHSVQKLQR